MKTNPLPPPSGVAKLVLASVPDPAPVAVGLLSRWVGTLPIEVVCHGPADQVVFDEWGRA